MITADALHTQRAHAEYLHERGAGFVFTVKHNQPTLFAALDALPWHEVPIAARDIDTGHGRITTRTIQVLPAPTDLPFPHVNQVWLIERYITDPAGTPRSAVAALGVTNLTTQPGTPECLAALVRDHWGIESLHWLRDTVYREDNSTVHTRSGPRVMAALRNLAIGAIRLTADATSPKQPARQAEPWTAPSRSSNSYDDLETPVGTLLGRTQTTLLRPLFFEHTRPTHFTPASNITIMPDMPPSSVNMPSARQLLVSWANDQEGWLRLLAGEVLATRRGLAPDTLDWLYQRYLSEKGLSEAPLEAVSELRLDETSGDELREFVLTKLSEVSGVNALADSQEIEFNPGLTVLFGENGAGKTGYARVLKTMAAVRGAESILANVNDRSGATTTPSARLDYSIDQLPKSIEWRNEAGLHPFTHLSIFDSPAMTFHVDGDQAYLYTPSDLALFKHCADAITDICKRAEEDIAAKTSKSNPFLAQFRPGTHVYQALDTLGPATDIGELRTLSAVTDAEQASISNRRDRIVALQPQTTNAQLGVARNRQRLHERLVEVAEAVGGFVSNTYNSSVESAASVERDYQALQTRVLGQEEVEDETRESWHGFVIAGLDYGQRRHGNHYPELNAPCLYCGQSLDEGAVALISEYRALLTDSMRQSIAQARSTAQSLSSNLTAIDVEVIRDLISAERDAGGADDPARLIAERVLGLLESVQPSLGELRPVDWQPLLAPTESLLTASTERADAVKSLISALETQQEQRAKKLSEETAALAELDDRLLLASKLDLISNHVRVAKWALKLRQLIRKVQPVQRSLTERAKQAGEQLLHADFVARFEEECRALRTPVVQLEFPGKHGEARRRKVAIQLG